LEQPSKSQSRKVREIFAAYFFSMLFAFTGGNASLSLLQQQMDDKYHLMDREKVLEFFALGQALPGVISLNAGILIGRDIAGWPGGLAAAAGIIAPAFFGMLFIALTYNYIGGVRYIRGAIQGIRSASIGLILTSGVAIIRLARRRTDWALLVLAFAATMFFGWNILAVILLCGFLGILEAAWKRKGNKPECM